MCRQVLLSLCMLWFFSPAIDTSAAEPEAEKSTLALERLRGAIQAEIDGDVLARDRLLAETLMLESQFAPAHWYQGRIASEDGRWLEVQQAIDEANSLTLLEEYERYRSTQAANVSGNWNAAMWWRATRARVSVQIALDERRVERSRPCSGTHGVGDVLVGNEWVSAEEQQIILAPRVEERVPATNSTAARSPGYFRLCKMARAVIVTPPWMN